MDTFKNVFIHIIVMCEMCGNGYVQVHMYFLIFKWLAIPVGLILLWIALPNVNFEMTNTIGLDAESIFSPMYIASFGATCIFIGVVIWIEALYMFYLNSKKVKKNGRKAKR